MSRYRDPELQVAENYVGRGSETQFQEGEYLNFIMVKVGENYSH